MKSYLFAITTLCFINTGFNVSVDAQEIFNYDYLKKSDNLSTDLAQNVENNPNNAEEYFNRGVLYLESGQTKKAI